MRPCLVPAALLAALALAPLARAGDADAKKTEVELPKLDWNPYAKAAAGDWSLRRSTRWAELGGTRSDEVTVLIETKVDKVENDAVSATLSRETWRDGKAVPSRSRTEPRSFSRVKTPALDRLFDLGAGTISKATSEEEKRTVLGRELACTKVTILSASEKTKAVLSVWLSREAKAPGVVAVRLEETRESPAGEVLFVTEDELAGTGSKDSIEWGKSKDQVVKAVEERGSVARKVDEDEDDPAPRKRKRGGDDKAALPPEPLLTIAMKNVSLKTVVEEIARQAGYAKEVVIDPALGSLKITLNFVDTPVSEAFSFVRDLTGAETDVDAKGVIHVSKKK